MWMRDVLAELEAAGLVTLADKGYQGSTYAKIPYKGKNKPESQKQANKTHAKLRAPGERANAQLKTWKILTKLRCCPWRAGQLARAIHVLQIRETKPGWKRLIGRCRGRREAAPGRRHQASGHERAYRHQPAYTGAPIGWRRGRCRGCLGRLIADDCRYWRTRI